MYSKVCFKDYILQSGTKQKTFTGTSRKVDITVRFLLHTKMVFDEHQEAN